MKQYVIALDQGTTSSRCILFDREQNIVGVAQREFTQIYPKPGWAEQDPHDWWRAVQETVQAVLAQSGVDPADIRGVGLSGQMHGLVMLDAQGQSHRPPYLQRHRLAVPPYRTSV